MREGDVFPGRCPGVTTEWTECCVCLVKPLTYISAALWWDFQLWSPSWCEITTVVFWVDVTSFGCQVLLLEEVISFYGSRTSLTFFALLLEAQEMMLCLQRNAPTHECLASDSSPISPNLLAGSHSPSCLLHAGPSAVHADRPIISFGVLPNRRVSLWTHEHCLPILGCFTVALPDRHQLMRLLLLH